MDLERPLLWRWIVWRVEPIKTHPSLVTTLHHRFLQETNCLTRCFCVFSIFWTSTFYSELRYLLEGQCYNVTTAMRLTVVFNFMILLFCLENNEFSSCYRILSQCSAEVEVTLRPTVSRPVRLGVLPLLEQVTRCYIYFSDNYFLYFSCRTPSLTRGRVCICSAMTQVQFQVTLRLTVCRPVRLGAGPPMGSITRF
jgi:hypothetical protein